MLARTFANWTAGLSVSDLPPAVIADCRLRVLDILGIALAAAATPVGRAVHAGAAALGVGNDATLIGFGGRSSTILAALVNGTLAHAMDFDDTHIASVMHPSTVTVSAALAMVETLDGSGEDLILAVAIGNEIGCRLGLAAPGAFHEPGFHPTSVLGTSAAALACGRLLHLPAAALVSAQGITGSQAAGILEAYSDGTWSKTLHGGWGAQAGISAARLAEAGFTGPESVYEGRYGLFRSHLQAPDQAFDFSAATADLGQRWTMLETAFKLYPCAHSIHAFIEGALLLRAKHHLRIDDIAQAVLQVPAGFVGQIAEPRAAKLAPQTVTHARASLFYAVATALIDGEVSMDHYTEAAIGRGDILDLASRLTHEAVPDARPIRFSGRIGIERRNGEYLTALVEEADGTGSRLLDRTAIEAKFARTAGTVLSPDRVGAIVDLVGRLETLPRLDGLGPLLTIAGLA